MHQGTGTAATVVVAQVPPGTGTVVRLKLKPVVAVTAVMVKHAASLKHVVDVPIDVPAAAMPVDEPALTQTKHQ